jgi:hypothetical protein
MIAQNIVHAALLAGHSALFITASQLLLDLGAQESTRALDRRLRYYSSRALLCIDEIGYLSYDTRNADLLFQVVSRRYERRSLVLTTNLAFSEWSSVFPNAACTTALIDRVVPPRRHHRHRGRQLPQARGAGRHQQAEGIRPREAVELIVPSRLRGFTRPPTTTRGFASRADPTHASDRTQAGGRGQDRRIVFAWLVPVRPAAQAA